MLPATGGWPLVAGAARFVDPDQSVSAVNRVLIAPPIIGDNPMSQNDANDLAELGEDILTFDASDDSLERAAVVTDGQAITIGHCHALVALQLAAIASGKEP